MHLTLSNSEDASGEPSGGKPVRVAIFGGRGAGEITAEIIGRQALPEFRVELVGYLNDTIPSGESLLGGAVIGSFDSWRSLGDDIRFAAPLHKATEMSARMERFDSLGVPADRLATLVDPMAVLAPTANLSPGAVVGPFAIVGPSVSLGRLVSLWPAAQLGHDVHIEDFVFVGRAAIISGYCALACGAYVGPGAVIREGCRIGRFAVVAAGAMVAKDVPDGAIVAGNPARAVAVPRL
jgi:sugar O-acyltransferase (sialic acid O-acetyltransferase NeuD family)